MSPLIFLLLALVALYLVLSMFVRALYQRKRVKKLKRLAINERNRNRFGKLRTKLMALARNKEIDVRSPLFRALYTFATVLMRNPHSYKEAVNGILSLTDEQEIGGQQLSLSEKECILLIQYAHSLDELCRDYSPIYRYISQYMDHRDRRSSIPPVPLWIKMRAMRIKRQEVIEEPSNQIKETIKNVREAEEEARSAIKAKNGLLSLANESAPPDSEYTGRLQPA